MRNCLLILVLITTNVIGQSPVNADRVDSFFRSYFRDTIPGGAVLVAKDGKIIYKKAFGVSDIQTKQPNTTSTLFNTGSISKTFVAYGILKLAQEKKLSLEDDLYKYFPDFKSPAIAKKVKLFHLLTHTSGLPDSRQVSEKTGFYMYAGDEGNFAPLKQTTEFVFEPGTKFRYSNPAFNGLALIIEKVSGQKWQDYIRNQIFIPSGMKTSTITDGPHPASGVAHAYTRNKEGIYTEMDYGEYATFTAAGNGGVWSTVEELWLYEQAIRNFSFLDKKWIDRSRIVYPFTEWKDTSASQLGLSWFLTQQSGEKMIGHTGTQGGFMADYCWFPEHNIFYVMLCNRPIQRIEIREKLLALLIKN